MAKPAVNQHDWVGRTEIVPDDVSPMHAAAIAATLDAGHTAVASGDALPALWHWCYFLPRVAQHALDEDGHPQRGGFMPPVPYPRRMFAGARMAFHAPLRIGQPATRHGEIRDINLKSGRSGSLAFVTVAYRVMQNDVLCIEEEQDIVYREPGAPIGAAVPVAPEPLAAGEWSRTITPDSRLLFRFSALTFNAHRIHYDRDYAMRIEGYPGLVVHGPLTAMLLTALVRAKDARPIARFSFRGVSPLFDGAPCRLVVTPNGAGAAMRAEAADGTLALSATVDFA
jgi:3-methylfumaryl-CoA hydratase